MAGLLIEDRPGLLAFPHALVRDAVYATMSQLRRGRLHARAATAIERRRPDDVTAIAHHLHTAADPALAGSTLRYARLAETAAERRYAHRDAIRWWQVALRAADDSGPAADRLELLVAQVRALASAGDLVAARDLRAGTLALADAIDDPHLAAAAISSFYVPTIWTSRPYGMVDESVVRRTEDLLGRLPPGDGGTRCRMLINLAIELEGEDD
jgi:hypothetical protein